jgi:hypothetical protein
MKHVSKKSALKLAIIVLAVTSLGLSVNFVNAAVDVNTAKDAANATNIDAGSSSTAPDAGSNLVLPDASVVTMPDQNPATTTMVQPSEPSATTSTSVESNTDTLNNNEIITTTVSPVPVQDKANGATSPMTVESGVTPTSATVTTVDTVTDNKADANKSKSLMTLDIAGKNVSVSQKMVDDASINVGDNKNKVILAQEKVDAAQKKLDLANKKLDAANKKLENSKKKLAADQKILTDLQAAPVQPQP